MNILIIFIPLLFSFVISFLCPMSRDSGASIMARPPGFVFGIVWPILYIMVGLSWYYAKTEYTSVISIMFMINLMFNYLWVYLYSCRGNKLYALWDIILMIISTLGLIIYLTKINIISSMLLIPYFGWLLFASMLNYSIVNM